ncbi:MAG: iron-sulfur cluster carrier protein NfuA [Candidatus Westeberhardia cardiocondylae]|nr:iron-sulfur cluster carrier protein NfuA [Candidatus Westeberhardia cardiocondylae]
MIDIDKKAENYIEKLINKTKNEQQIRIIITNPGTPYAKCIFSYFKKGKIKINEIELKFKKFSLYVNESLLPYIQNAKIKIISEEFKSQLILETPNITYNNIKNNQKNIKNNTNHKEILSATLKQIKKFIKLYINPTLIHHGGQIKVIKINNNMKVLLKFYGGCNGCTMAKYTLKEQIENKLLRHFPELNGVEDITKHQHNKYSYY